MEGWTPSQPLLLEIVELIRLSFVGNQQVQKEVYRKLNERQNTNDFNRYLLVIFINLKEEEKIDIRSSAGITLKNNIKQFYQLFSPDTQNYIKQHILCTIGDQTEIIRKISANIIASITHCTGIETWTFEILNYFINIINQGIPNDKLFELDGLFRCINEIIDDYTPLIQMEKKNAIKTQQQSPLLDSWNALLDVLVPPILNLLQVSPYAVYRSYSLQFIQSLLWSIPSVLEKNFAIYLQGIINLFNETDIEVRKKVVQTLQSLVSTKHLLPTLAPYFTHIVEFILSCYHRSEEISDNETLIYSASEFWIPILESNHLPIFNIIKSYLPRLCGEMIKNIQYSESDQYLLLRDIERHQKSVDNLSSIKPLSYSSDYDKHKQSDDDSDDDDDDSDDDDDDDDEDEEEDDDDDALHSNDFGLRKLCISIFETLIEKYEEEMVTGILPQIPTLLQSEKWAVVEGGIVVLSLFANVCPPPFASTALQYLLSQLQSNNSVIKSISCWSLGKFAAFIQKNSPEEGISVVLQSILPLILDSSKDVQCSACNALIAYIAVLPNNCFPPSFLTPILNTLSLASNVYQAKNRIVLYCVIKEIAKGMVKVGERSIRESDIFNQFFSSFPPLLRFLVNQFTSANLEDKSICTICETLSPIFEIYQHHFPSDFAVEIYEFCIYVSNYYLLQLATGDPTVDRDFIASTLDLICELIEFVSKVPENNNNSKLFTTIKDDKQLLNIIIQCLSSKYNDLKFCGFTMIGDFAKLIFQSHLLPSLSSIFPHYLNLSIRPPYDEEVLNNCIWSFGQLLSAASSPTLLFSAIDNFHQLQGKVITTSTSPSSSPLSSSSSVMVVKEYLLKCFLHFSSVFAHPTFRSAKKKLISQSLASSLSLIASFIPDIICMQLYFPFPLKDWIFSISFIDDPQEMQLSLFLLVETLALKPDVMIVQYDPPSSPVHVLESVIKKVESPSPQLITKVKDLFDFYHFHFPQLWQN